jgi:hypothetical protein
MTSRILMAFLALTCLAQAQTPTKYHSGKLLQMESVQCIVAEPQQPTAPASTVDCEEYVLQAQGVLFHFRARDPKHPVSLPVGKIAQYRVQEGHFFVRVDGREREFQVVAMEPVASKGAPVSSVKLNHLQ